MTQSVKHKAVRASIWRFAEVGGRQLISLVVTTLLARFIVPEQYGMVAMVLVFNAIAEVFIDAGFSTALIRDSKRTSLDCSTIFWFNIAISVLFCVTLQLCAPLIARFYKMPELTTVTRIVSLTLIIIGLGSVQRTLLSAEMNFKRITNANIIGLSISGIIAIVMAYKGFQVWALVTQLLLTNAISTSIIWFKSSWHPSLEFSKESFHRYFTFGSRLLASALLNTIYKNCYTLVIGKVFSSATLAFYNRAYNFGNTASGVPTSIVESVTFPALCKLQEDNDRLRNGYRRIFRLTTFVVFPLCLGLGAVAYPFICVLLTERWLFAAKLMQILVFSQMWYPLHSINLNLLKVSGNGNLFFRLEIWKKCLGVAVLCISVPFGITAMCIGSIATSLICLIINTYYTGKILNLGFWRQMYDILPCLLLSLSMFGITLPVTRILGNGVLSLVLGIVTGAIIYIGGALLFRFPEVKELKNLRK